MFKLKHEGRKWSRDCNGCGGGVLAGALVVVVEVDESGSDAVFIMVMEVERWLKKVMELLVWLESSVGSRGLKSSGVERVLVVVFSWWSNTSKQNSFTKYRIYNGIHVMGSLLISALCLCTADTSTVLSPPPASLFKKTDIDDQTTLHYWATQKSLNSSEPKPALVLIHGFGPEAKWQWRKQAVFFAARGFSVYVPNLVFFGGSATTSEDRSEVFQAVSVGKLLHNLGVMRYSVVGTSYGGMVAYHMGAIANAHKIEELLLPAKAAQLRALLGLAVYRRAYYMPDFLLNDVIHKLYTENRKEKMELLRGLTLGRDNIVNLSPLQQEVLIVWGEHDQIFPLEKATELKELLGEKARLEVIKNTAHVPQIENPGRFNNIVYNFLCASSSSS
ncbi:alpha/beta-Hydrolases superfamily protein [Actinidia rufa]|uniref:Alpha/beta-Hydrolases superfamily protein n=1 Tax=Actinidia rufa TaxID=165716 RepID=A0A7J0FAD5_9ERIC|nr:alpha/beta-Hydrolases superfamily protein [Actinidia rufa]